MSILKKIRLPRLRLDTLVRVSAVLTLGALGLMVWSLFDPTVVPVIVAMSLGQALGTLSFGLFLLVVVVDRRRAWAQRGGVGAILSIRPSNASRDERTADDGPSSLKK